MEAFSINPRGLGDVGRREEDHSRVLMVIGGRGWRITIFGMMVSAR